MKVKIRMRSVIPVLCANDGMLLHRIWPLDEKLAACRLKPLNLRRPLPVEMFSPYGDRFLSFGAKPVSYCAIPPFRSTSSCEGVFTLRGKFLPFGANKAWGMLPDTSSISEYLCPWKCFTLREKIQKLFEVCFGGHWEIAPPICFSIRVMSPPEIWLTRQLFQSSRPCKTFVLRGVRSEPILYHISSLWNITGEKSGSSLFAIKKRERQIWI